MPMDGGTGKPPLQAFDMAPEEVFLYLYRTVPEISLECAEIIITFDRYCRCNNLIEIFIISVTLYTVTLL